MSLLVLKMSAFFFNTITDLHESPMTFTCCNIISCQWWSNLIWFMNEQLFYVKLSEIPPHNTRYDRFYAVCTSKYFVLAKKWYPGLTSYCVL